jgi:hypothetical protein
MKPVQQHGEWDADRESREPEKERQSHPRAGYVARGHNGAVDEVVDAEQQDRRR